MSNNNLSSCLSVAPLMLFVPAILGSALMMIDAEDVGQNCRLVPRASIVLLLTERAARELDCKKIQPVSRFLHPRDPTFPWREKRR